MNNMGKNNKKTGAWRRRVKKYAIPFRAAVAATALVIALTSMACASFLPGKLGDWRLSSEHVTELIESGSEVLSSKDLGKWTNAFYVRNAPIAGIEVQLMEGPGPGGLFVPEGVVSSDDGPIGFLSTYETLDVAGRRALLERNDVTGQALAVALGMRTVTFEASGISREELLDFAAILIEELESK